MKYEKKSNNTGIISRGESARSKI